MTTLRRTLLTSLGIALSGVAILAVAFALASAPQADAQRALDDGHAGVLHWSGVWTGNQFWCDSGYQLVFYHYDCGCSNNASWYACIARPYPNPSLTLSTNTIERGQSATLTWEAGSSMRETGGTCTAVGFDNTTSMPGYWSTTEFCYNFGEWFSFCGEFPVWNPPYTAENQGGSVTVSPNQTTTYRYTCSNPQGSETRTATLTVTVNGAPTRPTVTGQQTVILGILRTYTFQSTDPEGQGLSYHVDTDSNGTVDYRLPAVGRTPSGTTLSQAISWLSVGNKTISVYAQDASGAVSPTATYNVVVDPATPQCSDGLDNNNNGVADFSGGDVRCDNGGDTTEDTTPPLPSCQDGLDNDGDGLRDAADTGCGNPNDGSELNVTLSATPSTIDSGASSLLRWSSVGATSCTGTGFNTGNAANNNTGVAVSPASTATYQINCVGSSGPATAQTTVTVGTPTATFTASPTLVSPGSASTLSWSTTGLASCSISGQNGFSYAVPGGSLASGNTSAPNIQGRVVFTLSCTTVGGGNLTRTAEVRIAPAFSEF